MKPEILLIRANGKDRGQLCIPWGIVNIASYLKKYGYEARVMNRTMGLRFINRFKKEMKNPNVIYVGISAMTCQARDAEFLCSYIKKVKKKIILGGLHYTILPQEGLKIGDYVFRGESEQSILYFLENGPTSRVYDAKPLLDLDEIPLPDEALINKFYLSRDLFTIMTSRGCPYNCGFCLDKKYRFSKIRYHSAEYVCGLIEMLVHSFDLRNFFIGDDIFTINKKRVFEICHGIKKRGLKIRLDAFTHSGIDDLELYREMKSAGFKSLALGIECGYDEVLRAINKDQTVEQAMKTARIIKKSGLELNPQFMVGNILESEESLKATLGLAKKLHSISAVCYAQPFIGTKFYEVSSRYGKIINNNPKTYWYDKIAFVPIGLSKLKLRYYRNKILIECGVYPHWIKRLLIKIYEKMKLIQCFIGHFFA